MNIKTFRIKNHLSVIKMAELVGISRQHIYDLEKRKTYPSRKLAAKIQDVTNGEITAGEILGINQTGQGAQITGSAVNPPQDANPARTIAQAG